MVIPKQKIGFLNDSKSPFFFINYQELEKHLGLIIWF